MSEPLLKKIVRTAPDTLEDLLLVMAKNVETSLLAAGAEPGKDYSIRDLYNWGTPFALDVFRCKDKEITYAIEF